MKKQLKLPKFKNEDEERDFWANIDFGDYAEPGDFVPVSFPNLKPTTRAVSVRIPEYILGRLKEQANALNIPYQSLMKQYIAQGATGRSIMRPHTLQRSVVRRGESAKQSGKVHIVGAR